jgi:hypothetical protein
MDSFLGFKKRQMPVAGLRRGTNVTDLLLVILFIVVVALFWLFVWWNRE